MKILFIENKFKTPLWDEVASKLIAEGHEVHWLVQNRLHKPKNGTVHYISLPHQGQLKYVRVYHWLERMDRYCTIYNQTPLHYEYYNKEINSIVTSIKPNFVFGEATLFHELLTISICKSQKILYLHPITCRYPNERFSFYLYDTLKPFLGSGECWSGKKIERSISAINERKIKPDYMQRASFIKQNKRKLKMLYNWLISVVGSELLGEKYNTPTIKQKLAKELERKKSHSTYESLAIKSIDNISFKGSIIYPLQLQPEQNLDVWGCEYNRQYDVVSALAELGSVIYIKPNPKSKYEINDELIKVFKKSDNVKLLSHSIPMEKLFNKADFFYSTSGTINLECIFSGAKCFSPVLPISKLFSSFGFFPTSEALKSLVKPDLKEGKKLMQYLIKTSYPGVICDSIHSTISLSEGNIELLYSAFSSVINNENK